MKNKMFKIIASLFVIVLMLLCINLLFGATISQNGIVWLKKVLEVTFFVTVALLILSTITAALLSIKECIKKEGRQYVDKFLLKVVCIFALLYVFRTNDSGYLNGIIYPALIWIFVPRAYDYITTNE